MKTYNHQFLSISCFVIALLVSLLFFKLNKKDIIVESNNKIRCTAKSNVYPYLDTEYSHIVGASLEWKVDLKTWKKLRYPRNIIFKIETPKEWHKEYGVASVTVLWLKDSVWRQEENETHISYNPMEEGEAIIRLWEIDPNAELHIKVHYMGRETYKSKHGNHITQEIIDSINSTCVIGEIPSEL